MLDLVELEDLRYETILLFQTYAFFNDFSKEVLSSAKALNLMFAKNFVFAFKTRLYLMDFFSRTNFTMYLGLYVNPKYIQKFRFLGPVVKFYDSFLNEATTALLSDDVVLDEESLL